MFKPVRFAAFFLIPVLLGPAFAFASGGGEVPEVSFVWVMPFILLLLSIAVMPLVNHHFWEKWYPAFAVVFGLITATYYLLFHPQLELSRAAWTGEMKEYVSFICLLGSLYIVSGGIVVGVSRRAMPITNTVLLLSGAVLSNVVGTTGAAMLLIRPFIRMNRNHIKPFHIVFFIFVVANCGGCLTPIGDPPLFIGYLKGVPFLWTAETLWPKWLLCNAIILAIFFILDELDHRKVARTIDPAHDAGPGVSIFGFQNFVFIGMILWGVFRPSIFDELHDGRYFAVLYSREVLMVLAAVISKLTTKKYIYERNEFTFGPIREVAILFIGIFSTMVPALNYLDKHSDQLPLKSPGQYFFVSGTLSAVLDNAPTYLVFLETKQGKMHKENAAELEEVLKLADEHEPGVVPATPARVSPVVSNTYEALVKYNRPLVSAGKVTEADARIAMLVGNPDFAKYLIAISIGSVFFGAMTYIGNGPNFMVRSIAVSQGIRMPSFFGYIFRYSLPILLPIYILIWLVFFVL